SASLVFSLAGLRSAVRSLRLSWARLCGWAAVGLRRLLFSFFSAHRLRLECCRLADRKDTNHETAGRWFATEAPEPRSAHCIWRSESRATFRPPLRVSRRRTPIRGRLKSV